MCRQNRGGGFSPLPAEKVIANVDLTPFDFVEVQGGEALFIPEATLFLEHAIRQSKKLAILTNGLLLNESWADKFARHGARVHISLNAATKEIHEIVNRGSCWERVLRNIELLREARERHKSDLRIRGHMTVIEENIHEVSLFIERFQAFGFDEIQFGVDRLVPPFLAAAPSLRRQLALQVDEALANCERSRVNTYRLELLKLVGNSEMQPAALSDVSITDMPSWRRRTGDGDETGC
jgi:sulfatase maturation enzyme AslB (radical SAM superfamily)